MGAAVDKYGAMESEVLTVFRRSVRTSYPILAVLELQIGKVSCYARRSGTRRRRRQETGRRSV